MPPINPPSFSGAMPLLQKRLPNILATSRGNMFDKLDLDLRDQSRGLQQRNLAADPITGPRPIVKNYFGPNAPLLNQQAVAQDQWLNPQAYADPQSAPMPRPAPGGDFAPLGGGGRSGGGGGGFGGMSHGAHIGGPDPTGTNKLPSGSYTAGGLNDPDLPANRQNRFNQLTQQAHAADRLRDGGPPAPFVPPQGPGADTGGSMEDEQGNEVTARAYGGPVPPGHSAIVGDRPDGRRNKTEEIVTALPGGGFTVTPNPSTRLHPSMRPPPPVPLHPSMLPLPRLAQGTDPTLDQRLLAEGWSQQDRFKQDASLAADGITDLGGGNRVLNNLYGSGFSTTRKDTNVPALPHVMDQQGQVRFSGNKFDGYQPDVVPAGSAWAASNGFMPSDPVPVRDNIQFQTEQLQQEAPIRRAGDDLLRSRRIAQSLADGGVDAGRLMPPPRPMPPQYAGQRTDYFRPEAEGFTPAPPRSLFRPPEQDYGLPMLPPGVADQMASTRAGRATLFGLQQQQQAGQQRFQQELGKTAFEKGLEQQGRMQVEQYREKGRNERAKPVTIAKPGPGEVTFQGKHMVKGDQGPNGAVTPIANSNFGYMEDGGKHVMMENKGTADTPRWAPFVKPTAAAAAQTKPVLGSFEFKDKDGNVTKRQYQHDPATDSWYLPKMADTATKPSGFLGRTFGK